ncbi:MAG TPA: ribbon-helix-helix domain-containing protein [Firmicutes bacterium]|nr:ribbon-helix-helix domain-containing protein [Bacillota bacterium]
MPEMVRKQFYIEPRQDALLKQRARHLGITEAELVREALDAYASEAIVARLDPTAWQREKAFIEALVSKASPSATRPEKVQMERSAGDADTRKNAEGVERAVAQRGWTRDELHER